MKTKANNKDMSASEYWGLIVVFLLAFIGLVGFQVFVLV